MTFMCIFTSIRSSMKTKDFDIALNKKFQLLSSGMVDVNLLSICRWRNILNTKNQSEKMQSKNNVFEKTKHLTKQPRALLWHISTLLCSWRWKITVLDVNKVKNTKNAKFVANSWSAFHCFILKIFCRTVLAYITETSPSMASWKNCGITLCLWQGKWGKQMSSGLVFLIKHFFEVKLLCGFSFPLWLLVVIFWLHCLGFFPIILVLALLLIDWITSLTIQLSLCYYL